jgi:hypothetical protein
VDLLLDFDFRETTHSAPPQGSWRRRARSRIFAPLLQFGHHEAKGTMDRAAIAVKRGPTPATVHPHAQHGFPRLMHASPIRVDSLPERRDTPTAVRVHFRTSAEHGLSRRAQPRSPVRQGSGTQPE